jgi:hypothetical protein
MNLNFLAVGDHLQSPRKFPKRSLVEGVIEDRETDSVWHRRRTLRRSFGQGALRNTRAGEGGHETAVHVPTSGRGLHRWPCVKQATTVAIKFANGETVRTPTFAAPRPLERVRFYATPLPKDQLSTKKGSGLAAAGRASDVAHTPRPTRACCRVS